MNILQTRNSQSEFQQAIESIGVQKAAAETDCIEAMLSCVEYLHVAKMMGLREQDFSDDSFIILYRILPLLANEPEEKRIRLIGEVLKTHHLFDDTCLPNSRGTLWGYRSLVRASRSWPKGTTCFVRTVPALLSINKRLHDARKFYACAMLALKGVAA